MKVYTRGGDKGKTSLIGGTRVPKYDIRIEAYGTVDEVNSWMGLLRDHAPDEGIKKTLIEIQDRLFTLGSQLAADPEKSRMKLPPILDADIFYLEEEIDRMDATLPEMRSFVLPGGHPVVSYAHIARCVCRRAERATIQLSDHSPTPEIAIRYLNRLSDYLFVLARALAQVLETEEILWKPRM